MLEVNSFSLTFLWNHISRDWSVFILIRLIGASLDVLCSGKVLILLSFCRKQIQIQLEALGGEKNKRLLSLQQRDQGSEVKPRENKAQ